MVPIRPSAARPLRLLLLMLVLLGLHAAPAQAGCTQTPAQWSSKSGASWPAPYSRNALFFSSGLTWQQILDTPSNGNNAYLILAHQAIAAMLSRASGASAPFAVRAVIDHAVAWFSGGPTPASCTRACPAQRDWASVLDLYNSGIYPGAPPLCSS